jgi:hypothetical protein
MTISKQFWCKFSRQKHICSSFNCTWHVCKYFLNNAWKSINMTCWLKIFVDKLNIVYSKHESVVVEKQKKRSLRERLNEHKRCTSNCLQTKEKTSFFRTKLSSSFYWENEKTCEIHIKRKIDVKSARRWWKISRQKMKLYKNLITLKSFFAIHIKTRRIKLINYFFFRRVFIMLTSNCICEYSK